MNKQIIYYLNKKTLLEEYFNNKEELNLFIDIDINIPEKNLELLFSNNNLILTQLEINLIKNDIISFVGEKNNFGTTTRVLSRNLISYENFINEKNNDKEIIIEWNKEILGLYNNFIFRKIGIELIKKYNSINNYHGEKYILDKNKDNNDHVYFDSNYNTYIVINKNVYGYNFYFMNNKNDENIILELLEKKFPNVKFKICTGPGVTTIYFVPSKKNYLKIFYKLEDFLTKNNIKVNTDSVFYLG